MSRLSVSNRTFFGIEDDTWTALAIWAIIGLRGISGNINRILFYVFEEQISIDTILMGMIMVVFIFLGTMVAMKKLERRDFLLVMTITVLWFLSFLLSEDARRMLKGTYFSSVLIYGGCGIICISHFKDWDKFIKISLPFTIIGLTTFFLLAGLSISGIAFTGYMNFSYENLVFVISAFWIAIHKRNLLMWIAAPVGVIILIFTGCRGAVLCVFVYIILEFLLSKNIHIVSKVLFFSVLTLIFFNLENLMMGLDRYIKQFGYSSRTIEMFFEGTLQDDSGRTTIFEYAWELIKEKPVLGYGMAGSSVPLFEKIEGFTPTGGQGAYSHNLFLELMLHFGIFLGGSICVWLIVYTVRAYIKCKKTHSYNIIFLFFSITIPKLMLSSIYLSEPEFFVFLGLILNLCYETYEHKQKQLSKNI